MVIEKVERSTKTISPPAARKAGNFQKRTGSVAVLTSKIVEAKSVKPPQTVALKTTKLYKNVEPKSTKPPQTVALKS